MIFDLTLLRHKIYIIMLLHNWLTRKRNDMIQCYIFILHKTEYIYRKIDIIQQHYGIHL